MTMFQSRGRGLFGRTSSGLDVWHLSASAGLKKRRLACLDGDIDIGGGISASVGH